jgi:hypothetical protein
VNKNPTGILCSGVALGVYNPALILKNALEAEGQSCRIFVLENLHDNKRRDNIMKVKQAFHRNFLLACNSQKKTGDIADTFDLHLIEELSAQWETDGIRVFCVFSGFWLPVIKFHKQRHSGTSFDIHLCYMDAVPSTSWKPFLNESATYSEHRLFDYYGKKVNCHMQISDVNIKKQRQDRVVVHGGGWGMGSYRRAVEKLSERELSMDIICYERNDIKNIKGSRNFMIDPCWKPWEMTDSAYIFPPFAEVKADACPVFEIPDHHPAVYDLVSQARAVISKPGGATLLDSFSSATPLVFMNEPFGDYEEKNGELWRMLGFGIDFDTWCKSNFSIPLLNDLHENIIKYKEKNAPPFLHMEILHAA